MMKAKRILLLLPLASLCLLLTSCFDSNTPLSDPAKSKVDQRLAGVWQLRNDDGSVSYYHFGRVGDKLPASVMRVAGIQHKPDFAMEQFSELLVFPTTIDGKTYLNVCDGKDEQLKVLEEKGWTAETVHAFLIFKYQIKDDVLVVQGMDKDAKQRAIESGKIKGVIEKDRFTTVRFTDTTENLAQFVAEAGDELFSESVVRLERVK